MTSPGKAAPMSRDEALLFVQLISGNPAIISKGTNVTNNKIKDDAWNTLTSQFNASVSSYPRTCAQLRLKWENLKKSARKRCADMRSSINKTGGGKDYFPPDEVLEQVATILGNTCTGFTVEFGGDAATNDVVVENVQNIVVVGSEGDGSGEGINEASNKENVIAPTPHIKSFYLNKASGSGTLAKRMFKLEEEKCKARIQRDTALTEYLIAKKKKIDLENEEKELNIAKLKLELENARKKE